MANAPKILDDSDIIYDVFEGYILKIYPEDDDIAKFIKNYIITAYVETLCFEEQYKEKRKIYNIQYAKWWKKGCPKNKKPKHHYWWIGMTKHFVELKVNHYRQKYWYWKKLKK